MTAGPTVLKSSSYAIFLDHQCLVSNLTSFIETWTLLFAAYFVFNVEYIPSALCTLEFFQR